MTNFQIHFSYPWLLLAIIPLLIFALIPYFKVAKKYRRTRNRVISLVSHILIIVMSVSLLSGMFFTYDVPNDGNEVMLVVDMSDSNGKKNEDKDKFIRKVIDNMLPEVKLGIVTFGYDQVYASPLSKNFDEVLDNYNSAQLPDKTATDIASALSFASSKFTRPELGKIVLLSDGAETDGEALRSIRAISATGVKVDTVHFGNEQGNEMQITNIEYPEEKILVNEKFKLGINIDSTVTSEAFVRVFDNKQEIASGRISVVQGKQKIELTHTFQTAGLHELSFSLQPVNDSLAENNVYHSYMYLNVYDKILVITRKEEESQALTEIIRNFDIGAEGFEGYNVEVVNVEDNKKMPKTVDQLRGYDEVVLFNIANADMPQKEVDGYNFDEVLNEYVYKYGGGLLTVGGDKVDDQGKVVANTYDRADMQSKQHPLYSQMLPVQAIDYTPPVGVMIVIDRSGSMSTSDEGSTKTRLELAKEGALACLDVLTERDWCGVMTLETTYNEEVQLTPMPQRAKIEVAIDEIQLGGGTVFTGAIERAGSALSALNVSRRHIILVTDGQPGDKLWDNDVEKTGGYGGMIKHWNEVAGITLSVVSISPTESDEEAMKTAANLGGGAYYGIKNPATLPQKMGDDLKVDSIKAYNPEEFIPKINDHTLVVNGIEQADMPKLGGYYGTKVKDGAQVPLMGKYEVPVYAQWKYGKGNVGSFMCDLNGKWSADFMASTTGLKLLNNIIVSLFPSDDIRISEISTLLKGENYKTQMSIFTHLEEGDNIQVTVTSPSGNDGQPVIQTFSPSVAEGQSRLEFEIRQSGVHKILVEKKNANGELLSSAVTYKSFAYSKEYDAFVDQKQCVDYLKDLAESGNGIYVENMFDIFNSISRTVSQKYDPRILFAILIIVLFVIDIAVRKFKFKWPHELIRERKLKKEYKNDGQGGDRQ